MQINLLLDPAILFGAVSQGLLWSVLAIGVYITYRILDFADLTTEGSFPLGAAVAAKYILAGWNPIVATLAATCTGMLAGLITGLLHTKLKIPGLLSGILVMTGLYSVNLKIMGKANLTLLKKDTIITMVTNSGISKAMAVFLVGAVAATIVILLLWLFFSTEIGFAVRATGDNPKMIRSLGVNTDRMVILGLVISNALIALSGGLIAQYNGYGDVGMGTGTIVIGLASVIIGEVIFGRTSILRSLISVVLGSVLYRIIIAYILDKNLMESTDLKLLSSILLAVCLTLPIVKEKIAQLVSTRTKNLEDSAEKRRGKQNAKN